MCVEEQELYWSKIQPRSIGKGNLVKYKDVEDLIEYNEYLRDYISYLLGTYTGKEFYALVKKKKYLTKSYTRL